MTDRKPVHEMSPEEFNAYLEELRPHLEALGRGEQYMMDALAQVADAIVAPEASEPVGDGEGAVELTDLHPVYKDESKAMEEAIARFNAKWTQTEDEV